MKIKSFTNVLYIMLIIFSVTGKAEVIFSTNIDSSSSNYGFQGIFDTNGNYQLEYLPTGGFDSTGGAHILLNQYGNQFPFAFYHYGGKPNGGWTWNDVAYVRFRIKFDDNFRWDGEGSQQNKMIDIGGGENSRVILHNERERPSEPCALNYTEYTSSGPIVYNTAEDYGLPADAFTTGNYGSLALKNGISPPCTTPVVVTHGVWYHVQFAVKISSSDYTPDGYFKLWVNNNDFNNPSTQELNIIRSLGEWNSSWDVGHYWTHENSYRTQGWVIDDYQTATTFDPSWAPAGATPALTQDTIVTAAIIPDTGDSTVVSDTGSVIFTDNFDSGTFNAWDYVTGTMTNVDSNCAEGTNCVRTQLTAGTYNNYYADYVFGDHVSVGEDKIEEVYLRLYSKFDAGYIWANRSQKIALLNLTDGNTSDRRYQVYIYVTPEGYYAVDHSYIDTWDFMRLSQNQGDPVPVRFDQWDSLKLYVRLNDPGFANGVVNLWINNTLKISYSNVNIRQSTNYGINKLIMSTYTTGDGGSDGVQWHDDFLLSTFDPDDVPLDIKYPPNPPVIIQ